MKNNKIGSLVKAKDYCFKLLSLRQRSQKELEDKLKGKKFDPSIIEQVVSFLREKKFIDDSCFARAWVQSRIKKPFGLRRISQELKAKGIDRGIIEDSLAEAGKDYREDEVVFLLARERMNKQTGISKEKVRQRVYGYLLRRGFSPEIIMEALSKHEQDQD